MALTNMKLSPKEAKTMLGCCEPEQGDGPAYPYGLSISLNDDTLKKLGMDAMPEIGAKMQLMAVVEVTSTSQYNQQSGTDKNVSLQITDMALASPGADPASKMYGKA